MLLRPLGSLRAQRAAWAAESAPGVPLRRWDAGNPGTTGQAVPDGASRRGTEGAFGRPKPGEKVVPIPSASDCHLEAAPCSRSTRIPSSAYLNPVAQVEAKRLPPHRSRLLRSSRPHRPACSDPVSRPGPPTMHRWPQDRPQRRSHQRSEVERRRRCSRSATVGSPVATTATTRSSCRSLPRADAHTVQRLAGARDVPFPGALRPKRRAALAPPAGTLCAPLLRLPRWCGRAAAASCPLARPYDLA